MMIGKIIAAWRKQERYGVRGAATLIGISASSLNRIELGETCCADTLVKLMAFLWSNT